MLLSAVSVFVFAQSSSEIPEGLMNNLVLWKRTGNVYTSVMDKLKETNTDNIV